MSTDPINRENNVDLLGVVPNITWSYKNIVYVICVLISFLIISYGLALHFSTFNDDYYSEVATVTNVDCINFPVNNHRSEYHCVIGIKYPTSPGSIDMTQTSLVFVDSEKFFEGDQIEILVDRRNSLNIKIKMISDQNLAIIYCLCGLLLLVIVTGVRFIRIV